MATRPDELRAAIRRFREGPEELTPVVNVYTHDRQPTIPDSDPPDSAMSLAGPGGFRLRRAPAWLLLALGIVAIVVAGAAYVATHL
jgi:hypothetical protein